MGKALVTKPRQWQFLLVCALIGAGSFFAIYGVNTLNVGNEAWIWAAVPEGDVVQNYAGWMAYRSSPWSFPLAFTDGVCWPDGTLITYMDANPLLSALLKIFSPLQPETFVVYGWFTLGCYMLQGVAAGLLGQLVCQKPWQAWGVALLFCFSPILMERSFRHTQMAAQFLLLFAIYYYLRMRREGYTRLYWQYLLLNVLSVGIFPYFLPMVMALLFAGLVEDVIARRKWAKPVAFLAANLAASLAAGYLIGAIGWQSSVYSRGGYGYFSMNLNALFNPQSLGDYRWSLLLGAHPQQAGQYDGFNYLGLGVLLFLALAVVHWLCRHASGGRPVRGLLSAAGGFVRRYAVLLAVCACLTLFAVTNHVVLHDKTLLDIPLPKAILSLCGIFRASARLFYPVYYLLLLFAVRYIFRHFDGRRASVLLAILVAVQLADLSAVVVQKHRFFADTPQVESPLSDPILQAAAAGCDTLILLEETIPNHYYVALAAKYGMKTNLRDVNSGDYPGAVQAGHDAQAALYAGKPEPGVLYMTGDAGTAADLWEILADAPVEFCQYEEYCFIFCEEALM